MNIWLVTIGSSDVQLDSDNESRKKGRNEKQRSDKIWRYWYEDEVSEDCYDIAFEPKQAYKDKNEPYRIEPRVLGMVYESSSLDIQKEIWSYLTFPLLDNFVGKLEESPPDAIVVLLTDQSKFFNSNDERRKLKCPYWQDTCKLEPILKQYFQEKFPDTKCVWITLSPASGKKGLDDWNYVLDLVRNSLRDQLNSEEIKVHSNDKVYVSHQAGTPAISSAVQFSSLARFGGRVKFLVSSERDSNLTRVLNSSTYLRGIRLQEAKALLERHDYSGVKELLESYLEPEVKILLDAAIQWNFAKFENFEKEIKDALKNSSFQNLLKKVEERTKEENWWWTAYETAYLGVIRLEQKNAIEAFFHSFRSVEGLISKWAESCFSEHIEPNNDTPLLKSSILNVFPNYLGKKDQAERKAEFQKKETLILSGFPLYALLRADRQNWKKECKDITIFIEKISPRRNKLFHRLKGLQQAEVFQEWQVESQEEWEARILHYLNFVTKQTFSSLKDASLMSQVHQELENAIAS